MAISVRDIISAMPPRFDPEAAAGLDAVFQFDVYGEEAGQWYLVIKDATCRIEEGRHSSPNVTLTMGSADFVDMMLGNLSGQQAFFSGKLRISGDLMLAQRLENFFNRD